MKKFIILVITLVNLSLINLSLYAKPLVVAIDIGHTLKHYGALSARGVGEYQFNKKIAKVLNDQLNKKGIKSFIINPSGKEISLKERVKIAKDKGANLFIALHHDSAQAQFFSTWNYKGKKLKYCDRFAGYSIFVSHKNPFFKESLKFAKLLGESLKRAKIHPSLHHAQKIKGENRELLNRSLGIYRFDDLIVLKYSKMPALLLECGVIVNRKEELKLSSNKFRKKLADAITKAIIAYKKSLLSKKRD